MKKICKGLAAVLSAGITALLTMTLVIQAKLPDTFQIDQGGELRIHSTISASVAATGEAVAAAWQGEPTTYQMDLSLYGKIPLKQVAVQVVPRKMVIPGGAPFGIKMFTKGVMIVGMSDIQSGIETVNPAKSAGLKIGDILLSIDGIPLTRNEDVKNHMMNSQGNEVEISLIRGDTPMSVYLQPVQTDYDHQYKAGIWVRDSSAGIGTLTYYNPNTMGFAGLGHAICDVDTGKLMPLSSGEIVNVNINGVNAGESGKPGELKGTFTSARAIGQLRLNCELGIFGVLEQKLLEADPIPMAHKQEVVTGPAVIYSTISGNKPQAFDIAIEKINYLDSSSTKNMIVRVTDPALLAATGGIVQGMSGSPIIQNGMLVGAVTHVFVNDPTRGYAVFAENMDAQLAAAERGIAA
ncbi:SpoIVB peptidase [Ruminococcaceae bacterium OttesenSCG-928-L11]|nr:SpoIVB peptidase [Ruminococcaceae bacterium OttesenSCG-928-L11]